MAPRRITSLTSLLIFIALAFTSIFTYLAPRGPGSSDWTALGVSKHKWQALHTDLGIIFIIVGIIHILFNLKPIGAYLKNKFGKNHVFNINFNIALAITLLVIIGSLFSLPPFGSIQDFKQDRGNRERHHAKEIAVEEEEGVTSGEAKEQLPPKPPLFYSGRSLSRLAGKYEIDIPKILKGLKELGIEAAPKWTFKEIANHNDMETKSVYEAVLQVQ